MSRFDGCISRHFVILLFAARWIAGERVLNDEPTEAPWLEPAAMTGVKTTDGLLEIIENAVAIMKRLQGGKGESVVICTGAVPGACATLQGFAFPPTSPMLGTPGACRRRARHAG